MKLDLEFLQRNLPIRIKYFDEIDSTSLYLNRLIKENKPIYGLVIADYQTNGQGRVGRNFYSPRSTGLYLTFSFLKKEILCKHITPRIALAVIDAIDQVFGVWCSVKWVNDVYLDRKKVAGVLCQNIGDYYLFGIGINVEEPENIPSELSGRFGSLCSTCEDQMYSDLVVKLYDCILLSLKAEKEKVLETYREKCVHLNQKVLIENNSSQIEGLCIGIDDDFSLVLEIDGKKTSFSSGFVTLKI